jgi:CheY-like chemotaxis protein
MHILVVDDERAFADVLTELLRGEGHVVRTVYDGVQALEHIEASGELPDLMVCDVMLPRLRGDELVRQLRTHFSAHRLPVVMLSASADPKLNLHEVEFLPKPVDLAELVACIERLGTRLPKSSAA